MIVLALGAIAFLIFAGIKWKATLGVLLMILAIAVVLAVVIGVCYLGETVSEAGATKLITTRISDFKKKRCTIVEVVD